MLIITNMARLILYMSEVYVGKEHDFSILKHEFGPQKGWFKKFTVLVDLGFKGFKDHYKCRSLKIPHRKKRQRELDDKQKEENKAISRERICVEHGIGGMKRYGILKERVRNKDWVGFNRISGVCAGLWNFTLCV